LIVVIVDVVAVVVVEPGVNIDKIHGGNDVLESAFSNIGESM
jgi:hypothetical protein